jgi:hypothetical protein
MAVRRFSFWMAEAIERALVPSRLAPYLLVPFALGFLIWAESTLLPDSAPAWIIGPSMHPVTARLSLSLWNAGVVISLFCAVIMPLNTSRTFGSSWFRSLMAIPGGRTGALLAEVLVNAVTATFILLMTQVAISLALPMPPDFPWAGVLLPIWIMLMWTIAFGAFAGLLTSGPSAVVLELAVLGSAIGPALFSGMGWSLNVFGGVTISALLPPFAGMLETGASGYPDGSLLPAALVHVAAPLLMALMLFRLGRPVR